MKGKRIGHRDWRLVVCQAGSAMVAVRNPYGPQAGMPLSAAHGDTPA
ncbi:MAG: hypothetical protein ACLPYS_02335 [Vulcanimicrobiaceae bacterium]